MKIPTLALALSQLLNFDSFLDDSPNPPFCDLSQASQRVAPTLLPSPNSSSLVLGRVVIGRSFQVTRPCPDPISLLTTVEGRNVKSVAKARVEGLSHR
jgi:hypothetical protein